MVTQAALSASRARLASHHRSRAKRVAVRALITVLYLVQPAARLLGRLRYGLTPWRTRPRPSRARPWPSRLELWRERGRAPEETLAALEAELRAERAAVRRGGDFDRWDLEVHGGLFGRVRLLVGIEEHGAGRQLVRHRLSPRPTPPALMAVGLFALLAVAAAVGGAAPVAIALTVIAAALVLLVTRDCAVAAGGLRQAIAASEREAGEGAPLEPTA
jgi:hypothetical protein